MIIVCFLLLLKKKASKNGFINIQAFKIVIGSIMLIILSENLFLWLSFQNYWHKIIQNILVPVVKPPFSPSFVSMHFVTFLKCTFSILNFLWYILMIFSHLLSYQRNDRIPLLAASFWCCVSIWLRLVKEGRSERNNFNDPGRVAWTKVTAIEMVRNRFWIYFKGRTKRMFSIRYGLWRKGSHKWHYDFSTKQLEKWSFHQLRWKGNEASLGGKMEFSLGEGKCETVSRPSKYAEWVAGDETGGGQMFRVLGI